MGIVEDRGETKKSVAWGGETAPSKPSWIVKAKKILGHAGLSIGLIIYTALGAYMFMILESDAETERKKTMLQDLHDGRSELKTAILSGVNGLNLTLDAYLRRYETVIDKVFENNIINFIDETNVENIHLLRDWDYVKSAFFAATVVTTIGYGDMAPHTDGGRVFCIFFAFIGIPLTLTVLADLGKLMAALLKYSYKKFRKHFPKKATGSSKLSNKTIGKSAAFFGILSFGLYITAGGGLCMLLTRGTQNWTFVESIYFSFITMTTIGFGDFVPTEHYIVYILYVMIGLALTSTVIELVRSAAYMEKMREFSSRLQGLSGPLAESLRKYGDKLNFDVNVLRDLKALQRALAINSGKVKREGSIWNKFWENQDGFDMDIVESDEPKLIQITIYESTV